MMLIFPVGRVQLQRSGMIALAALSVALVSARAQVYEGRELVKAELVADSTAITPGKTFTAGLLLRIVPGWHTYWKFSGDAGIPIELKWKLPPGWKAGELRWPIPLKFDDPGDIKTYGYHDEVLVLQEITPPASLSEGTVKLPADASWLVCEKICIPGSAVVNLTLPTGHDGAAANAALFDRYRKLLPRDLPAADQVSLSWSPARNVLQLKVHGREFARHAQVDFYPLPDDKIVVGHPAVETHTADEVTFKIPIESGGEGMTSLPGLLVFGEQADGSDRQAWSISAAGGSSTASVTAQPPSRPARWLITYLVFGFIGGFILNLMPCVLPVISLKIFGFIQQAGQSRQKILRSGLAFTAGIFAWFIGLALLLIALKGAGQQISWAFQFTNAYFVLFMSAVVLVFALNLFGVFEISLPQSAASGLLGATAAEGNAASFFQGVFATVLATPCTAPFLGTALGFAFTQSGAVILAMFAAIAAGMSAPYLVLCAQPAWLRFLPRPGPWMVRTKQFMGFLLLATLLFLLYVLGAQRGLEALIWASSFLLIVSIACWMKGAFVTPVASTRGRAVAIVLMLLLLAGSGFYFIGQKFA